MVAKLESKLAEHEQKLEKATLSLNGQIMQLQANSLFQNEKYKEAFRDYCLAVSFYTETDDIPNLSRVIECIKSCLNHLTKDDVLSIKVVDNVDIAEVLNDLQEKKPTISGAMIVDIREKLYELRKQADK
ncbi:hypothetical protein [Flavobacterium humidisoli]|uniref:Tetratricopeptide repeat-containing protein n=1 Tax=Flavobacterium humidisoli TaxID=2937442 RepID=A0ABY4LQL8_9FLAO|nr:hypothetical protein [Flavobacterium humidisoli]UPZ14519.1 hypothetical protein M0M44_17325 [Flavobacterium humidisoli]